MKKYKITIDKHNLEIYRNGFREDILRWRDTHIHNSRRLDVILVLVASAIFYDTTKIDEASCLKFSIQTLSISVIVLNIIDHAFAKFYIPRINKKANEAWAFLMCINIENLSDKDLRKLNILLDQQSERQEFFSTFINVFAIVELICVLTAIIGELILRV